MGSPKVRATASSLDFHATKATRRPDRRPRESMGWSDKVRRHAVVELFYPKRWRFLTAFACLVCFQSAEHVSAWGPLPTGRGDVFWVQLSTLSLRSFWR